MSASRQAREPRDPDFERRVRGSFAQQAFMATLGVEIERLEPGRVVLAMPFAADFTQQHGTLHAGAIAALADSACGYAALGLATPDTAVLSVEFKINLLAPAAGERFVADATVTKSGRTLSVCDATVRGLADGEAKLVATMTATIMTIAGRGLLD